MFRRNDHHPSALMVANIAKRLHENRSPIGGRAVFALCLFAVLGGGCQDPSPTASPEATETKSQQHPSQVVEQGYFEYTEHGKVVQSLQAASLKLWESDEEDPESPPLWHVDGGFILFIGGTRECHSARLSAIRGTYDDQVGKLEAWDEVVLVNDVGERLETEHLIWSHDSDLVRTDRPVEIQTPQGILRGKGLRADSQFERYTILEPTGSFELGVE